MSMTKVDLKRERGELYRATERPTLLEVPPRPFLMIDGTGGPADAGFQQAVGALYTVAYTLKFELKRAGRADWVVPPLEGLWWRDWAGEPGLVDVAGLSWRAMIPQPDEVTADDVERARTLASRKRDLPALPLLRFEVFDEGLAAQVLHVGPYATEHATVERLLAFIAEQGYRPHGAHHEIYLGDPNRTDPERLRTIIRQTVMR